jgi:hypothetical protein
MSKARLKFLLWSMLVVMLAASIWLVVSGSAALLAYFNRGADPASALNLTPNVPANLHVRLTWRSDDADTGRLIDPFTRTQIESAYLRAWLQWNLSLRRGEPYSLKTYFIGPALDDMVTTLSQTTKQGWQTSQIDSSHELQLHFYSADGAIASFTDHDVLLSQIIRDDTGKVVFAGETRASYTVVMLQEEGNWRVRSWVRTAGDALEDELPLAGEQPGAGMVARHGRELTLDNQPYQMAGINYYPQGTPWDRFWPGYDPRIIDQDFALMRSLGLNTIRIFVPYEQFGGPDVDPAMMDRLADLLARAEGQGLKVIVTLFDFRSDYNLVLWPEADRHLETLLTRFAPYRAILAWDLKNEPDLDYAANGPETVNLWLAHTARLARAADPHHLLTIGWSNPEAAQHLANTVDLVSFHYYAPAADLPARYQALRAAVPARPLALTEYGLPTWNSFFFPGGHSEPEQAAYYADILGFLRTSDSAGALAWTLYDFDHVPPGVVGRLPWRTRPQQYLGVLRADGTTKQVARLLAPDASLRVTRAPGWARLFKPFWLSVAALIALGALIALRWRSQWLARLAARYPRIKGR